MPHNADRRLLLAGLGAAGALAIARTARAATCGDAGPLGPQGATLPEIYDKFGPAAQSRADYATPIESLPSSVTAQHVISVSGVYCMTQNMFGETSKACLSIEASQVEVWCNGFVFYGVPGARGCIVTPSPQSNICVYDPSFQTWPDTCIHFANSSNCLVEEGWVKDCDGAGPNGTSPGTIVLGPRGFLYDCDSYDSIGPMSVGSYGAIEECMSVGGSGGCFAGTGDAVVIEDSFALSNTGYGVSVSSRSTVILCRCVSNGGVFVGAQCVVYDNEISDSPGAGITVSGTQNNLEENYICACPSGIEVLAGGGGTLIDGNHIAGASVSSIYVDAGAPGCLVIRNQAQAGGPGSVTYSIGAGSSYGPVFSVVGVGDISVVAASSHPLGNAEY